MSYRTWFMAVGVMVCMAGCKPGDEPVGGELKSTLPSAGTVEGAESAPAAPPITNAPPPGKPAGR